MILNLQVCSLKKDNIPKKNKFKLWIACILKNFNINTYEITIRIVDELESKDINARYRKKNKPTNILSFPIIFDKKKIFFLVIY